MGLWHFGGVACRGPRSPAIDPSGACPVFEWRAISASLRGPEGLRRVAMSRGAGARFTMLQGTLLLL